MKFARTLIDSFGTDIYIDLGTANTLVMEKNKGLVANEPSVIAYYEFNDGRRRIVAVGSEAKRKMGRTPGNLIASRPLKDGVVAELDATEMMLKYFMNTARKAARWAKPRLVISLPFGVSDVEKKAVRDCGMAAGAREVALIEEPMAAAIGSGLPVHSSKGNMVIDIGGGTTEVAVISLYGIVHCEAVRVGGHAFDEAIVEALRRRFNILVGDQSAERLKIRIGTALPGDHETKATIRGIDFATGLPREITVTSHDVYEALSPLLNEIIEAGKRTLENTPPELLSDIIDNGIVVAGGGALMHGLADRLHRELHVPVRIADSPLLAIAKGGEQTINEPGLLSKIVLA
ncbi:MAG TPA: rod shape-determining protein [Bdellovibrionales bacterium]|nr:rod shape-determining protein [Bdellovibrionales bacterium]